MAEDFGFRHQDFLSSMKDENFQQLAEKDFAQTARYGVRGFPMVIAEIDQQYYALANGYTTLEDMKERMEQALNMVKELG